MQRYVNCVLIIALLLHKVILVVSVALITVQDTYQAQIRPEALLSLNLIPARTRKPRSDSQLRCESPKLFRKQVLCLLICTL